MKNIVLFLSLLLSIFLLCSCNPVDVVEVPQVAITTATTTNDLAVFEKDRIRITGEIDSLLGMHTLRVSNKMGGDTLVFDSLAFELELEEDFPVLLSIHHEAHRSVPIFAMPGDSMHVSISLSGILFERHNHQYNGDSAKENEVLLALEKVLSLDNPKYKQKLYIPEVDFLAKVDSLQNEGNKLKGALVQSKAIDNPHFNYLSEVFINYKLRHILKIYANLQRRKFPELERSANFHKKRNDLEIEDPRLLNHYLYFDDLVQKVKDIHGRNSEWSSRFNSIDSLFADTDIKNHLNYYFVKSELHLCSMFKDIEKMNAKTRAIPRLGGFNSLLGEYAYKLEQGMKDYKKTNPPRALLETVEESYTILIEN